jgi:hypothetical protein
MPIDKLDPFGKNKHDSRPKLDTSGGNNFTDREKKILRGVVP